MPEESRATPARMIGVFGGAFDPVHLGHLSLATTALSALGIDLLLWVPAGKPAHRPPLVAEARHRLTMLRLATAGKPSFRIDAAEIIQRCTSYTVPTLQRLRQQYPDSALVLILGFDAFCGLGGWHQWEKLPQLAHLALTGRPGYGNDLHNEPLRSQLDGFYKPVTSAEELRRSYCGAVINFATRPIDTSATYIRSMLAAGKEPAGLQTEIMSYIRRHRLYGWQDKARMYVGQGINTTGR